MRRKTGKSSHFTIWLKGGKMLLKQKNKEQHGEWQYAQSLTHTLQRIISCCWSREFIISVFIYQLSNPTSIPLLDSIIIPYIHYMPAAIKLLCEGRLSCVFPWAEHSVGLVWARLSCFWIKTFLDSFPQLNRLSGQWAWLTWCCVKQRIHPWSGNGHA